MKKKILVLCTGNSCRSQMAQGYLRLFANHKADIYSAGVESHGLNPRAVLIMKEDGIDISNQTSNNISEYLNISFDYVITVCDNAKERCPVFPSAAIQVHHNFGDPAKAGGLESDIMEEFRKVRNEIRDFSKEFIRHNIANQDETNQNQ